MIGVAEVHFEPLPASSAVEDRHLPRLAIGVHAQRVGGGPGLEGEKDGPQRRAAASAAWPRGAAGTAAGIGCSARSVGENRRREIITAPGTELDPDRRIVAMLGARGTVVALEGGAEKEVERLRELS